MPGGSINRVPLPNLPSDMLLRLSPPSLEYETDCKTRETLELRLCLERGIVLK